MDIGQNTAKAAWTLKPEGEARRLKKRDLECRYRLNTLKICLGVDTRDILSTHKKVNFLNRLLRNRMAGGVGGGGCEIPPYPNCRS